MDPQTLSDLYIDITRINHLSDRSESAIQFAKKILPRFAVACQTSTRGSDISGVDAWWNWIESPETVAVIAGASNPEMFPHRLSVIRMLLAATYVLLHENESSEQAVEALYTGD